MTPRAHPLSRNPADRIVRARVREPIRFPDLTERRALKLAAIPQYVSRIHFGVWHRRMGRPNFEHATGVFTPLYYVELESTDVALDPMSALHIHGETYLAKTLDPSGATDHIVREGRHTLLTGDAGHPTTVGHARLINVYTRYDPDPARRRVTTLPPEMGLGVAPSRVSELPELDGLIPAGRRPDFAESGTHVWHYGQTDPNRHVNGMEYLRTMESYVGDVLHQAGHDLRQVFFSRARIVYRKPCFRGEGYRRVVWLRGEAPVVVAGGYFKDGDAPTAHPSVVVELTLSRHDEEDERHFNSQSGKSPPETKPRRAP